MTRRFSIGERLPNGAFVTDTKVPLGTAWWLDSHGVAGRIHKSGLAAHPHLGRASKVEATIIKVDVERRRVDLRLERAINDSSAPQAAPTDMPAIGTRVWGEIRAIKPGYVLIQLPGRDRPAMLLCKNMSDELRREFDAGDVHTGEEIYVEVTSVELDRNKILRTDALAPEEENNQAPPIAA
jgi:small subunit ribosomal protein S1